MNKVLSLIKINLSHDLTIFKINSKKTSKKTKILLPIIITIYLMGFMGVYASMLMDKLKPMHLEFITITIFALIISIITITEGIYKSGSLLFNCKDDNLLLSLPIKKKTVLFVRILKFYIFELLYNSLFIIPVIIVYAINVVPDWTFYLSSFVALLVLPIVPIAISCIIGFLITFISSKFKGKNIVQTIVTMAFLLIVLYLSFNLEGFIKDIAKEATSLNDLITKLYYPVGAYISLINDFNILSLLSYILINILIFAVVVFILGKIYFKINSSQKRVLTSHKNTHYVIKSRSRLSAFIHKELNRFVATPVFITNAGFGLVLFVAACILCSLKFDSLIDMFLKANPKVKVSLITDNLPLIAYGLLCFSSLMTSITSSMISLEGKTFNILKSFPIKSSRIVLYKVITALVVMLPCLLLGDIILFIRFKFDIISIILILLGTLILPLVTELIGIIANLKYPKMDATNDTEVVKQSMSSMIATFVGLGLSGGTILVMIGLFNAGLCSSLIMLIFDLIYGLVAVGLLILLEKKCAGYFNNITT